MSGETDLPADQRPAASLCLEIARRSESLWERLARAPSDESLLPPPGLVDHHLGPWARAWAKDNPRALRRRLSWDNLDPRQAAAVLVSPPTLENPPEWTIDLLRYADRAAGKVGKNHATAQGEPIAFLDLWQPWIELAADQLAQEAGPALDLLAPQARADLQARLLSEIAFLSEATAYEAFDEYRDRRGADTPGVYRSFVTECLSDPLAVLYQQFPVLARQTCRRLRQWRQAVIELVERLRRDREEIADTFNQGGDPGLVESVKAGVSDRHHDGRQVLLLGFRGGLRLVYKPRSLEPEAAFARFLRWCTDHGLGITPPTARVLARPRYGWMEHVSQEPMPSQAAAREYYRSAGCLVALAYALRVEDLNAENLVATINGPVVVDAEVAVQPAREQLAAGEAAPAERDALGSCLDTSLLTQLRPGGEEDRGMGGLRGWARRSAWRRVWHEINSDRMSGEVGTEWTGPLENTVFVGDALIDPEQYADDLQEGFETAYRFLLSNRQALLADQGPLAGFHGTPVRVLFRDSQEYGRIVQLMGLPRNQRSGLAGSWLQEAMLSVFADSRDTPLLWPLAREERQALEREDLPWFGLPADKELMRTPGGAMLPGIFRHSGLVAVRRRIAALSEQDLEAQLELVRQALATESPNGPLGAALAGCADREAQDLPSLGRELATAVGEELETILEARDWAWDRWDLANGRLGTALFLAALARSGSSSLQATIERLVQGIDSPLEVAALRARNLNLGAFSGLGSLVWSLVWLSRLLHRPALLRPAAEVASWITPNRIEADRQFDLSTGVAGALMGLLALAEEGDQGALEAARRCGEHLLAHQEVSTSLGAGWRNPGGLVQAGWAHGTAGILRALAALGGAVDDSRFLVAATAALGHERRQFDSEQSNWPVLMIGSGKRTRRQWMVAGCWGAPGIALSRLLLPAALRDRVVDAECRRALDTTASAPLQPTDHLCCGVLGRSSILLTAAARTGDGERRAAAEELARVGVERAIQRGSFTVSADLYENRRSQPGLLDGVAGIGYQLLRLVDEKPLPDVLALELPSEQSERNRGSE